MPAQAKRIAFLVSETNTYQIVDAVSRVQLPVGTQISVVTPESLRQKQSARDTVSHADVIIADVMHFEFTDYLLGEISLEGKRVYALRSSRDDVRLTQAGFVFDEQVKAYFDHLSINNVKNLVLAVAQRELDASIAVGPAEAGATEGIYHPEAPNVFEGPGHFSSWYRARAQHRPDAPWIGVIIYGQTLVPGAIEPINHLISRLEAAGFNAFACFGELHRLFTQTLVTPEGAPMVDAVVSYGHKFSSGLRDDIFQAMADLGVPVINAVSPHYSSLPEWRGDPRGLNPTEVVWAINNPEISGLIEPSVLSGKIKVSGTRASTDVFAQKPVDESIQILTDRLKRLTTLERKPNRDKRVLILFYNNSPGKQNIGASYLNVFRSLVSILERLAAEGYTVDIPPDFSEDLIKSQILQFARNIGSWAPGELEKILESGRVITVDVATYQSWFDPLPHAYRIGVIEQWGTVDEAEIMQKGDAIVIPAIRLGNIALMPEPARGKGDDPMKIYHSPTIYPHHQYTAAYLWMRKVFQADAVIHLGTHGTHEWLPGKQIGLGHSCPPEVLSTDIPSFYPYIVDDVGEGIQAKRRGRATVIDHMIPPMKKGGLYHEYRKLAQLISTYRQAAEQGSQTAELKLLSISQLAERLGILKDLSITTLDASQIPELETYLTELSTTLMPYGLHTFGRSMSGQPLRDTLASILDHNPETERADMKARLKACGPTELDRLVAGLSGRYIPPGKGNDPLRNSEAIPTGKNFYGFDPAGLPTQEAWTLGKKAAEQIIARSLEDRGHYPQKVAMVLWATETIRNEGLNEATLLYLLGVKPRWHDSGRVEGIEVIPGRQLGRPRIDVLVNPSGLYRDLFPTQVEYLDEAIQKAATLSDVENLIAKNNATIEQHLVQGGYSPKEAKELATLRIFSEKPGNYGNRVVETTTGSQLWESDEDISRVYEKHTGYGFGKNRWGLNAHAALAKNLEAVDVASFSISSAVYGVMDNDDMYQYLGGLSLAAAKRSGQTPDTIVATQRASDAVAVQSLDKTLGAEMRSRYLNPEWIEGMQGEGYAGAKEMADFVEYLWGWEATVTDAVGDANWQQVFEVYVEDKYSLELKQFMDENNPWAFQGITARMMETIRKGYWDADESVQQTLAEEYIRSVLEHDVGCSDTTCGNPLLHEKMLEVVRVSRSLSAEQIAEFLKRLESATHRTLAEQTQDLRRTQAELQLGFEQQELPVTAEGYEMEKVSETRKQPVEKAEHAKLYAVLFAIFVVLMGAVGYWLKWRQMGAR